MTVFLHTGMYIKQPIICILINTFFRILMVIFIGGIVVYYTYRGIKVHMYIQQIKSQEVVADKNYINYLSKKVRGTLCYTTIMFIIGVIHMTSISLGKLADVLLIVTLCVGLSGNDYFLSKKDLIEIIEKRTK